jgi:hypothetical protein
MCFARCPGRQAGIIRKDEYKYWPVRVSPLHADSSGEIDFESEVYKTLPWGVYHRIEAAELFSFMEQFNAF